MTDFKPRCKDIAVETDHVEYSPLGTNVSKSNSKPPKKSKSGKVKHRSVDTQTELEDYVCLQESKPVSFSPYIRLRSSSPSTSPESQSEEDDLDHREKMEWMFQTTKTCARCHAMRPQVRLLRALKENLMKHRSSQYSLQKFTNIMPDEIGWDALGSGLQKVFVKLFKLSEAVGMLPVDPLLKKSSESVVASLKHILSHLPIPNNVTHTINIDKMNHPQTKAMAAYVFGWKLKEIIFLLRTVYKSDVSVILPLYFKAELVQADRIAYKSLTYAVQGMRNTSITHSSLSNDAEFLSKSVNDTSSVEFNDYGFDSMGSSDSDSCESDDTSPKESRRLTSRRFSKLERSTDGTLPLNRRISLHDQRESDFQILLAKTSDMTSDHDNVLQGLSMTQLMTMSRVVQSRISGIKSSVSEESSAARVVPRTISSVSHTHAVNSPPISSSSQGVPLARPIHSSQDISGVTSSRSVPLSDQSVHISSSSHGVVPLSNQDALPSKSGQNVSLPDPLSAPASFRINVSSHGSIQGRVLCEPIVPGQLQANASMAKLVTPKSLSHSNQVLEVAPSTSKNQLNLGSASSVSHSQPFVPPIPPLVSGNISSTNV